MVQKSVLFPWQALGDNQEEMTRRFAMQDILSMAVTLVTTLLANHAQGKGSVLQPTKVMLGKNADDSSWIAKPGKRNSQKPLQNLQNLEDNLTGLNKDYYQVSDFIEDLCCRMEDSNPAGAQAFMENVVYELQAFRIRCDHYFGKNTAECLSTLSQELEKMQETWKNSIDLKEPVMASACLVTMPEKPMSPAPIMVTSSCCQFFIYPWRKNPRIFPEEKTLPNKLSPS